jgi:hypothetical protein
MRLEMHMWIVTCVEWGHARCRTASLPLLSNSACFHVAVAVNRYVQATAYRANYARSFGYPLIWNVSGTLHTHVLGWKADLDIGGTSNSINIHEMKVRLSQPVH